MEAKKVNENETFQIRKNRYECINRSRITLFNAKVKSKTFEHFKLSQSREREFLLKTHEFNEKRIRFAAFLCDSGTADRSKIVQMPKMLLSFDRFRFTGSTALLLIIFGFYFVCCFMSWRSNVGRKYYRLYLEYGLVTEDVYC